MLQNFVDNAHACSGDRKAAMAQAYVSDDYTLQQVADAFGVHYATVRQAINKRS